MVKGYVKWFSQFKGFGFLTYREGDREVDIFVHHSDISGNPLRDNDEVEFEVGYDDIARKDRAKRVEGGTGDERDRYVEQPKGMGKYGKDDWGKGGDKGYGKKGGFRNDDDKGKDKGKGGKGWLPGDWECGECGANNFARRTECFSCRAPKPSQRDLDYERDKNAKAGRSRSRSRGRGGRSRSRSPVAARGRGRDDSRRR